MFGGLWGGERGWVVYCGLGGCWGCKKMHTQKNTHTHIQREKERNIHAHRKTHTYLYTHAHTLPDHNHPITFTCPPIHNLTHLTHTHTTHTPPHTLRFSGSSCRPAYPGFIVMKNPTRVSRGTVLPSTNVNCFLRSRTALRMQCSCCVCEGVWG